MLIFWDIDGTLMYCGSDGTKALSETFKELYDIDDAFHKVGIGSAMDSVIIDKIMDRFDIPKDDLDRIKSTYVVKLNDILEKDNDKRVLPGIRELIYFAERNGYTNSLLTSNLKVGAEAKLKSVGLDGYFKGGGFGDERGQKWDIAPSALKELEELTGRKFTPKDVIVIGDSVTDINTAKNLGYNSISVSTGWTEEKDLEDADPDILFENFGNPDAVMEVIKRMDRGE